MSAMQAMRGAWFQSRLSLDTKLQLYQTLLYGSETWMLLADDRGRLQSFHMNCQHQLLGIK